MNVTNKTEKTFSILNITEAQAITLLMIAASDERAVKLEVVDGGEFAVEETLNNLRQSLMADGLTLQGATNAG